MNHNIRFAIALSMLLPVGCGRNFVTRDGQSARSSFRLVDGDGYRDLLYREQPIWRDMIKYDAADRANTYKPYKHLYAFEAADGFVTKGADGTHPHHRGIFHGYKTQFGDFWHCRDVTQRHVKYLDDRELLSRDMARTAQVIDWVDKAERPVVREMRQVTTRVNSPRDIVMDFEITLESLVDEPVELGGDVHHAGFHFRAAQEVSGESAGNNAGHATYLYSAGATPLKNDIWENCNWAHMTFPINGKPYALTHFDAPTNLRPIQYSTRPYGRVGSAFLTRLNKETPLKLRYRLHLRDGAEPIAQEQLAAEYRQLSYFKR